MHEGGTPVERAWRLALANVGQVPWELIQPLDDASIYATFLAAKGEGVHRVGVASRRQASTGRSPSSRARATRSCFGGEYRGVRFAYLSTGRDLGVITEIFAAPPGLEQEPDAVYPAS